MKVVIDNKYSYETGKIKVKKGSKVVLPTPDWLRDVKGNTWVGKVTSLKSTYDGECMRIISLAK